MSAVQSQSMRVDPGYTGVLPDDSALLKAVSDGDTAAIGSLYDLHGSQCFSLALRLLQGDHEAAEDVVHQVFVRLWRSIRGDGAESESAGMWLLHMTRNACLDLVRARVAPSEMGGTYAGDVYLQ